MLKLVDVSSDPTAPVRARVPGRVLADARSLGFELAAWTTALVEGAPGHLSVVEGVMRHRGGRMLLELSNGVFEDYTLYTLFEDGAIVITESRPPALLWWLLRWGVQFRPQHRIDFACVQIRSIADLLEAHEARVRVHETRGARPVAPHDLRTFAAMRQRSHEARSAKAPGPRPAAELLARTESILRERAPEPAMRSHRVAAMPVAGLEARRRLDLVVAAGNAMLLPLVGLAASLLLGPPGAIAALGIVFTMEAIVKIITTKTRAQILREVFVPDLVWAEQNAGLPACPGRACAIASGWIGWLWLALGMLSLFAARKMLALPHEPAPAVLLLQWVGVGVFVTIGAVSRAKKRHVVC